MVCVRFAPSPTGFLHIGGARTALFNWMYARAQGGKFILRIEDTDCVRSKQEYLDEIMDSMQWLGLNWDEFYKQSDRFDLYREYAQKLLAQDKAYKDGEAVILKVPQKIIKIYDLIRDEITIDTKELKDQVLMKSDGSPTYSFACVIDDALMGVTTVIRGEDHISNTPKQILIYEALGFKIPKFAHLPLILDPEGGRMSKRAGATAVTEYRKLGFLPEAIVNYLMLLGWSPGNNQEKVAMTAALKTFSIKKINKAGAAFSMDKLTWLNSQYIKEMPVADLVKAMMPFIQERGWESRIESGIWLENVVKLFKPRFNTLADIVDWCAFLFEDKIILEEEAKAHVGEQFRDVFKELVEALRKIDVFDAKGAEEAFKQVVNQSGVNSGELVHALRCVLTGRAVGPSLFESMVLLGQDRTVKRLGEHFA